MSKSRLFTGKIKKLHGDQLTVDRYDHLDLSQAEPDLGLPTIDGSLLVGSTSSNIRTWSPVITAGTDTVVILSTLSNRFSDQPQALDIKGGAIVRGNLHVSGTAYLNDAEILTTQSGLTSVLGNSIINQVLQVNTTTNAVSTDTGALQVQGGVGIGLDLWVGGVGYIDNAQILTTATVDNYASKTTIVAGTDTAINTSTGVVTIWNTSTLQSVTDRGATTANAISITNTTLSTSSTTGALIVSGGVGVSQDVYVGQNLYVAGTAYLNDAEVLTTSSGLSSTLGQTEVSQNLFVNTTTNSTSTTTGAIVTPGGVGIGKDLYVGENLYVEGTAFLNNAEVLTTASRITSIEGLTQVTQDFVVNTTTNAISTNTGALQVVGGVGIGLDVRIGQNLYVSGTAYLNDAQVLTTSSGLSSTLGRTEVSQNLFVNTTTNSTSTTTGAIVTPGGVGIGQDVFVGGKLNISSTLNNTGTISGNALYVAGGVGIDGNLVVDGPAYFRNAVVFSGTATSIYSTATLYTDNFIDLHFPAGLGGSGGEWTIDDGKDIGHIYHHYKEDTGDEHGALIWHNESDELRWYMGGVEYVAGSQEWSFNTATFGVFRTGSILLQNATSATSTSTGTLVVAGGVGIGQDVYVGGNINFSGSLYNNGVLFSGGGGAGGFTSSDTPPEDPVEGERWYDTTLGLEFVWVLDENSGQWVEISTAGNGEKGADGSQGYGSVNFYTRNYTGDSTTTNFVISANLTVDNVFVFENGVMQFPTTDYTINGTTLSFLTAPATGVAVQIREINNAGSDLIPLTVSVQGTTTTSTVSVIDFVGNVVATNNGDVVTVTIEAGSPKISSIVVTDNSYTNLDDTAVALGGGYIKIIGSGFATGCSVLIGNVPATSTTFISSTEVRAQVPATAAGTYIVYLVNTDGGTAIRVNAITFSSTPTWVTSSGISGSSGTPVSVQLDATGATTFALQAGSTLPDGLTLTSGGLLSGTVNIESDTVYSVTVLATDNELQDSPRTFSITITAGDLLFMYNTLILTGNGTNNAQNNTFLDASTNNFTITRNGNTTQGTFTPYGSRWSNYFDGTGDFLGITTTTALQMTGDFTWEAWVYPLSLPGSGYKTFWGQRTSDSFIGGPCVVFDTSGNIVLFIANSGATNWAISGFNTGFTISLNQWQHLALVKSGTSLKLYKNGVAGTATTSSEAVGTVGSTTTLMAGAANGIQTVDGYMSNFRAVKGTAVYTSNFTPSTTPLTAISGTSLLTCQSNRFIDTSSNAYTVTKNGDTSVQRFSPFSPTQAYSTSTIGGSGYFDGTGDVLVGPTSNTVFQLTGNGGTGLTVEAWIYPISVTGSKQIVSYYAYTDGSAEQGWYFRVSDGQLQIGNAFGGTSRSGGSIPVNAWTHVAFVINSGSFYLYVNGVSVGAVAGIGSQDYSGATLVIGGMKQNGTYTNQVFNGYISNLRTTNTVVYASNFVPPLAPVTAVSGTQLLANMTNAGIIDNTMQNNLETVGGAQISTVQSKFGGSSMYFDGTGDYLIAPQYQNFDFGTGDFTVEAWIHMNSLPVNDYKQIVCFGTSASSQRWILFIDTRTSQSAPYLRFLSINSSGNVIIDVPGAGSSGWGANTWYHVAITRSGSTFKLFKDGVQNGATVTNAGSCPATASTGALYVGAEVGGGFANWNGYIDDLRISKGLARYTANFTPSIYPVKLS